MVTTILGRKLGMTQVWSDDDKLLPVTVIEAGPCVVTQVKTEKRDGYRAVQIGFGDIKAKKLNKPMAGPLRQGQRRAEASPRRGSSRRGRRASRSARRSRSRTSPTSSRSTSPARARVRASPAS